MNIEIKDYSKIIDVMPTIDVDDTYMIMIGFEDFSSLAYSFYDKEQFLSAYRDIMSKVGDLAYEHN